MSHLNQLYKDLLSEKGGDAQKNNEPSKEQSFYPLHEHPETLDYSEALYGTGEHVVSGDNLYPNKLDVNGVSFTYAEIIAMADLFDNYNDMMSAGKKELKRLQNLINRSKKYYEARMAGRKPSVRNPGTTDWQKATSGRYLKLAKENFAHFAPSDSTLTPGFSSAKKNHKSEWERYHRMAIHHARSGVSSADLEEGLVMNAFGDHFLTDAFAAGHLFNKDDVNKVFKSKMLKGKSVTSDGDRFIKNVAKKAFTGKVKSKFSKYEVVDRKCGIWRPNIHTTGRFYKLLKGILEQEPDMFGKSVVAKAIHDYLNDNPIEVTNKKGNKWRATGDGRLNTTNLNIMQKAVQQSIDNVSDSITNKAPYSVFYKKVWDYTPVPTAASEKVIKGLILKFTNPKSSALVDETVKLIHDNYLTILNELVKRKILKVA